MSESNNPSEPLVSVCIPTYNRAQKLQRAVDALLSSTYRNLEIIISDNASSDDTENVCLALEKLDSRIKYYRHPENRGPTANFEFARSQATGKYFLWHGDDDYLDSKYICDCINELERDASLVLVSGVAAYQDKWGIISRNITTSKINYKSPIVRVAKYLWAVTDNSIFCGIYRRAPTNKCNMPNCLAGDWIWVCEVLMVGKSKMLDHIYVHRSHGDTTSSSIKKIAETIGAQKWHKNFPNIALSLNVARHISNFSISKNPALYYSKYLIYAIIFIFLLIKQYADQTIFRAYHSKKLRSIAKSFISHNQKL